MIRMLEAHTEFRKGIFFVRLQGDLISSTLQTLKKEMSLLLQEGQMSHVVFNLKQVRSLDPAGLHALYYNNEIIMKNGGRCMFCPSECRNVGQILKDSHLKTQMTSIENELSAFTLIEI